MLLLYSRKKSTLHDVFFSFGNCSESEQLQFANHVLTVSAASASTYPEELPLYSSNRLLIPMGKCKRKNVEKTPTKSGFFNKMNKFKY
jgi:hypothetical protein